MMAILTVLLRALAVTASPIKQQGDLSTQASKSISLSHGSSNVSVQTGQRQQYPGGAGHWAASQTAQVNGAPPYAYGSTQWPHEQSQLSRGDVFGLITVSNDQNVNGETVVIYNDGTLGIKEPTSPGYLFEAILLEDYQLLVAPEPLATVKLNDNNVFFLNTSLFNPAPLFSSEQWSLKTRDGSTVVCPSWNSVLVYVADDQAVPCDDAVRVELSIVPISVD